MSVKQIAKQAKDKVEAHGGGEHLIGYMNDLCKSGNKVDFLVDLGDALAEHGLQLISGGTGSPDELYAAPE